MVVVYGGIEGTGICQAFHALLVIFREQWKCRGDVCWPECARMLLIAVVDVHGRGENRFGEDGKGFAVLKLV